MLVGPSGSGKTTLLSIMGCILQAANGSVKVDGLPRPPFGNAHFVSDCRILNGVQQCTRAVLSNQAHSCID